jgi:hypothetical protein
MTHKIDEGVTRRRQQHHASGFCRTPSCGEVLSAAIHASLRASSTLATSCVCEERQATRRPYDARATRSMVRWVSS